MILLIGILKKVVLMLLMLLLLILLHPVQIWDIS
jgi:hypothetical protein